MNNSAQMDGRTNVRRDGCSMPERVEEMVKLQQVGSAGGDVEMAEAFEGEKQDGREGMAGIKCLRCTKKGHVAAQCTTKFIL